MSTFEFSFDAADVASAFEDFLGELERFLETCSGTLHLEPHELDAWDLPDPTARSEFRASFSSFAKQQLLEHDLSQSVLIGPKGRVLALFEFADTGEFKMIELEPPYRVPLAGQGQETEAEPPTPYERQSESLHMYHLHVDGSQSRADKESITPLLETLHNYLLLDDVAVFWDPNATGDLNYHAMSLVRDAESIHYGDALDQHEYPEEIIGTVIVVEGIDEVDGFGY